MSDANVYICIKDQVPDRKVLIGALKDNVVLLGKNNLEKVMLESEFTKPIILGLVWKSSANDYCIPFLNYYAQNDFFVSNEKDHYRFISNNLIKILQYVHDKNGVEITLDLITCNLNSELFKTI